MTTLKLPPGVKVDDLQAKQRSRRGRTSKARGANFEKLTADAIAAYTGLPASDVFRTRTRHHGVDIGLSEQARRLFPFSVECKDQKTIKMPEWIRQAAENAIDGMPPIVIFKLPRNARNLYVTLDFDVFMRLVTKKG